MRKFFTILLAFISVSVMGQDITLTDSIDEISVVSFTRNTVNTGSLIKSDMLMKSDYGQEPSHVFTVMPSIFSYNDNGTEFGYGYFRIRGLDQTRVNVSIDGCPWNEAEDFGTYFANSPDLMSSMHSIKVERGASTLTNGVAGAAGGINLESVDLYTDTVSYIYLGGGSFNTNKVTAVYNMGDKHGWGLHLKGNTQSSDGYKDHSFNRSTSFTIKTGYRFNNNHKLDFLSMTGYHENGQGYIGNTIDEINEHPHINGCSADETDNWLMTMNRIQYAGRISDNFILTASTYLQYQDGSYRIDFNHWGEDKVPDFGLTHTMLGFNIMSKYYMDDVVLSLGTNTYTFKRNHFLGTNNKKCTYADYYDNTGNKNDVTLFGQLSYNILNNLLISGNIQQRNVYFSYTDNLDNHYSWGSERYGTNWHFVNYGATIEYAPFKTGKAYVRYNRIWREPTRTQMFFGNEYATFGDDGNLATVTPELCNNIEAGFEYADKGITANINLFGMWFDNELVLTGELGENGLPMHENADKSYRLGVEGVLNYNVYSNLYFNNAVSVSKNRLDTDYTGNKTHVMSPSFTYNGDLIWKDKSWTAGLNLNYRSEMYIDINNNYKIPDACTFNLYGNYVWKRFDIGLRVNNILNKVNYCNGTLGDTGPLYVRNAGTNFNVNIKYIF